MLLWANSRLVAMKVSIIVPVYNAAGFIKKCLISVGAQTMTENVECILVDDCGQDNSSQIIKEYISDYNGKVIFQLLKQERNQGPSAARNHGIREAKGEYIFFLDADDQITPLCIETLYTIAKENDADYVQGTYQDEPKFFNFIFLDDKKIIKSLLLDYNKIQFTPHNRLVRRQMILDHDLFFNEQIRVREDFLWMTFVAKYANRFAATPIETYIRGFNEGSLTHNINIEREIQGYRVLIETMAENLDSLLKGKQQELLLDTLLMCLRSKYYHNEQERQHLIKIIKGKSSLFECILLNIYLKTQNTKVLHALVKLYRHKDR